MKTVPGTQGYEQKIEAFIDASRGLVFEEINQDFLPFLPDLSSSPVHILDAGSGIGQNALALAKLDYWVTAAEPFAPFLDYGKQHHAHENIRWYQDSLPGLKALPEQASFDFILIDGVWHHLNEAEQTQALTRISELLNSGGHCAISLRNGPAGAGAHVFPTDSNDMILQAKQLGLNSVLHLTEQASKMPNKPQVIWSRIVLQKP